MNLNELKKLAEAATPGPWWSDQCEPADGHALAWIGNYFVDCDGGQRNYREQLDDAAFIAAANPQMIQRMIECVTLLADVVRTNLEDGKLTNEQYEWHRQALAAFNELNSEV